MRVHLESAPLGTMSVPNGTTALALLVRDEERTATCSTEGVELFEDGRMF
jgi:hypothetical protein